MKKLQSPVKETSVLIGSTLFVWASHPFFNLFLLEAPCGEEVRQAGRRLCGRDVDLEDNSTPSWILVREALA